MSLRDKILAREENANAPKPQVEAKAQVEVKQEELDELNAELDSEIKAEANSEAEPEVEPEEELTPEQLIARTTESYEDEIKKLREENAKRRKKEQRAKEKALEMADEVFKSEREEYESKLAKMAKELESLKSLKKEEQNIEKEVKKAESNAEFEALKSKLADLEKKAEEAQKAVEAQKAKEEEDRALRKQAAQNRFDTFLSEIPEEFKEAASAMFKGFSDPSEGLIAVTKYKAQGLFGKKTIEVVSQVPKENKHTDTNTLNPRERKARRTSALKEKRSGLRPGQRIL